SPRGETSHSTRIATELARTLLEGRPGAKLVRRDLARDPLPHIDSDFATGIYMPAADRTPDQARKVAVSDAAIEELLAADAVVIATGVINFNIPSTLKSWLDHVSRSGLTFRYTAEGPQGLVRGKKVFLVVASGGILSQGPAQAFDHAVAYLKSILGFLGMTDVELIRIEGVALGADAERAALARAQEAICEQAVAA